MIEICDHVRDGLFDSVITNLEQAVRERRAVLSLEKTGFAVGDRAKFTYETRPQYLNRYGVEIVRQHGPTQLIVKPMAPGKGGRLFRVNVTSLEKVT